MTNTTLDAPAADRCDKFRLVFNAPRPAKPIEVARLTKTGELEILNQEAWDAFVAKGQQRWSDYEELIHQLGKLRGAYAQPHR